jgi:hypothetical protein
MFTGLMERYVQRPDGAVIFGGLMEPVMFSGLMEPVMFTGLMERSCSPA